MIRQSESISNISAALAAAQNEIENVAKDAQNPHFKSTYATLGATIEAIRPVFAKHGISVIQIPTLCSDRLILTTRLLHSSGEYLEGDYPINPVKNDPQGYGSAVTYARRYSLMAVAGIAAEDDDGNAASETPAKPAFKPVATKQVRDDSTNVKPTTQRFVAPGPKDPVPEKLESGKAALEYVPASKLNDLFAVLRQLEPGITSAAAKQRIVEAAERIGAPDIKQITPAQFAKIEDEIRQVKLA